LTRPVLLHILGSYGASVPRRRRDVGASVCFFWWVLGSPPAATA
jgi:hypothetical protein